MKRKLKVEIESQPTDSACGATSLQAIYKYWNDPIAITEIMSVIPQLENGGTLAVQLGCHALLRGYTATIFTYNVQVFDPTWFKAPQIDLADRMRLQRELKKKSNSQLAMATGVYLSFLELGGQIRMQALDRQLIKNHVSREVPMLVGLSATFLYQESRERPHPPDEQGISGLPDDLGGEPVGHFVVLSGYNEENDEVRISDPLHPNPKSPEPNYWAPLEQVMAAVMLGIVTYDANLLVIEKKEETEI